MGESYEFRSNNPYGIKGANVQLLLIGSISLAVDDCKQECISYIRENLTIDNCVPYLLFSTDKCQDLDLREVVKYFMWKNMKEIGNRPEFQNLRPEQIKFLLPSSTSQSNPNNISWDLRESELLSNLLHSFFKWWEVEKNDRLKDFIEISSKFPLNITDSEVLRKIYRTDETLLQNPVCKDLYYKAIESKVFTERSARQNGSSQSAMIPRAECEVSVLKEENMAVKDFETNEEQPLESSSIQDWLRVEENLPVREQSTDLQEDHSVRSSAPYQIKHAESDQSSQTRVEIEDIAFGGIQNTEAGPEGASVCTDGNYPQMCVQKTEVRRDQKRVAEDEDDDIQVLEVVPAKRKVIAEIDLVDVSHDDLSSKDDTSSKTAKMYFICGVDERYLMEMDMEDFSIKKLAVFPSRKSSTRLLYYAGKVFAICSNTINAEGKEKRTRVVRYFDLKERIWVDAHNLKLARSNFTWTVLENRIYVLGGTKSPEGSIEKLSSSGAKWELDKYKLMIPRSHHAVCVMRGQIYLVGGQTQLPLWVKSNGLLQHVEVYEPDACAWTLSALFPESRVGHCVAAVDARLYVIGGRSTLSPGPSLTKCAVYCPTKNAWCDIAPLTQARQNASAFVMDGSIYVVGGNEGTPTLEKYEVEQRRLHPLALNRPLLRALQTRGDFIISNSNLFSKFQINYSTALKKSWLFKMGESIGSGRDASNLFGITKSNVRPLLVGATVLNMKDCKQACVSFIRELLTVQNCMFYFIFSIHRCRDRDLREAIIHFLLNNIQEIQDQATFRNLRSGEINYLLPLPASTSQNEEGSGDLVESEPLLSKLLFSLFKWWEMDRKGRLKDFTTISSKFPLTRVDAEVLRKIYRGDDMLRLDPTCQSLYLETIETKFFAERSKSKG